MREAIDMTGQVFGTLTVLHRGPNDKSGNTRWWCFCSACNETKLRTASNLRDGRIKSCFCQKFGPEICEKMRVSALRRWARYRGEI